MYAHCRGCTVCLFTRASQVVVEYVSAPHELEDLLVNQSVKHEDDTARPGVNAALAAVEAAKTVCEIVHLRLHLPHHPSQAAALADIKRIYERFASAEEVTGAVVREDGASDDEDAQGGADADTTAPKPAPGSDGEGSDGEQGGAASKKKLRMTRQLKVAELKKVGSHSVAPTLLHTRNCYTGQQAARGGGDVGRHRGRPQAAGAPEIVSVHGASATALEPEARLPGGQAGAGKAGV